MKITIELLEKLHACEKGLDWFKNQDSNDLKDLCLNAIEEDHFDWCNWLVVKLLNEENRIRYAVYAAELALPIFEKECPNDKRPRSAIEAAKKYLENPTEENRKDAADAADAVADAVADADAADAAYAADAVADAVADAAYATYNAYAADAAAATAYAAADAADATADAAAAHAADAIDCKKQIILYGINLIEEQNK